MKMKLVEYKWEVPENWRERTAAFMDYIYGEGVLPTSPRREENACLVPLRKDLYVSLCRELGFLYSDYGAYNLSRDGKALYAWRFEFQEDAK